MGGLSLSPGDLPTQRSNPGLPGCRQTRYHLSHQRALGVEKFTQVDDAKSPVEDYLRAVHGGNAVGDYAANNTQQLNGVIDYEILSPFGLGDFF